MTPAASLPFLKLNGDHTSLIVLSGRSDVGKTTIARALAQTLSAVHVRIDSIEHALRSAGWTVEGEGYDVAYAIAADNLRLGRTVRAISQVITRRRGRE